MRHTKDDQLLSDASGRESLADCLDSVVADLVMGNIRRYVLAYMPICEDVVAAACDDIAAPAFDKLVTTIIDMLEASWSEELETKERGQGRSEEQIVLDEYATMMRGPLVRMVVDSASLDLATSLVSSIVGSQKVRDIAKHNLSPNLKA